MKCKLHLVALTVLVLALSAAGCSGTPVGRPCFIGPDASSTAEAIIASPALECQTRTCLHMPANAVDLCTGECSDDDECEGDDATPCKNGFACMVPVTVGAFCCKKQCVCRDYLPETETGSYPTPAACNADEPINECCNLDGRRENANYPQCS